MFEFAGEWENPINAVFLAATAFIAWQVITFRNEKVDTDFVRLLFGCIAAVFFMLVLSQDVLELVRF